MKNNIQSVLDKTKVSQCGLAKSLNIPSQQVNMWCKNRKLIGVKWAYKIKNELKLESIEELYTEPKTNT